MKKPNLFKEWSGRNANLFPADKGAPLSVAVYPGEGQSTSNLNLNWTVKSFSDDLMVMRLEFDKPLYISSGEKPDIIEVKILDRNQLTSA